MSGISERNPFVGPRPIQPGEALHGRDTELRELYYALQARRIVVLHSPSGAGKSSLVQAGLIPRLREGGFDVWKPVRVNLDPSALEGVPADCNRYLLSALVSLEEELPAARRRSPAALAKLDLLEYLDTRPRRKTRSAQPVVLLFDQFEEVLTVAPRAVAAKQAFFDAVGRALDSTNYWALFIIREDYLAAFAPYRDRIPTQMSNTFRLDLLGLDGAREAAVALAEQGGRSFPAVDKLIRDLSLVQVQQLDGSFAAEQGQHVEPVHLQVVCRRLWSAMPEDDLSIDAEDIDEYAGVSEALGGYYDDTVATIAAGEVARERAIRDWIEHKLIVGGIRSQVRQGAGTSAGLDNQLITQLLDNYIVRAEQRAGANWFELSHDRMVAPISASNKAWARAHLHPLQVQAKLWEDGGRAPSLLLNPAMLIPARLWALDNPELLTAGEREYLELSEAVQREAQRRRLALIIATVVAVLAAIGSLGLFVEARWAEAEAEVAREKAQKAQEQAELERKAALEAQEQAERERKLALAAQAAAEDAQHRAEHEAKFGRDMQRVFEAYRQMAPFPDDVSDEIALGVTGWLAELETHDFQAILSKRMVSWEYFLREFADTGPINTEQIMRLDSDTLRALFWLIRGECVDEEQQMSVLGSSPMMAWIATKRCQMMLECVRKKCGDDGERCVRWTPGSEDLKEVLTPEVREHLRGCFAEFERERQAADEREPEAVIGALFEFMALDSYDKGRLTGEAEALAVGRDRGYERGFADAEQGKPFNNRQDPPKDPGQLNDDPEFVRGYRDGYQLEYEYWYARGFTEGSEDVPDSIDADVNAQQ